MVVILIIPIEEAAAEGLRILDAANVEETGVDILGLEVAFEKGLSFEV